MPQKLTRLSKTQRDLFSRLLPECPGKLPRPEIVQLLAEHDWNARKITDYTRVSRHNASRLRRTAEIPRLICEQMTECRVALGAVTPLGICLGVEAGPSIDPTKGLFGTRATAYQVAGLCDETWEAPPETSSGASQPKSPPFQPSERQLRQKTPNPANWITSASPGETHQDAFSSGHKVRTQEFGPLHRNHY